jgi:hypothetical protein
VAVLDLKTRQRKTLIPGCSQNRMGISTGRKIAGDAHVQRLRPSRSGLHDWRQTG